MLWQILLCSLCAIWFFKRWRWMRLTSNIPTMPSTLPIIGVAHHGFGSNESLWTSMDGFSCEINALGGIAKTWMGPFLIIGLTDADLGLTMMNCYLEKHHFYSLTTPLFGEGLLTSSVPLWKRHRKLLHPAFNQHVINGFLPTFNQQSELLVEALNGKAGKGEFDPTQIVSEIALETVCQTVIGLPTGPNNTLSQDYLKALGKALDIMVFRITKIWLHPSFIYNKTSMKQDEAKTLDIIKKMSAKMIATAKNSKQRECLNEKFQNNTSTSRGTKSFFKLLMDLNDRGQLNDIETKEETDTIIATGYDTTSTTLQILLVILRSYPEVQARLYHEIKKVIPESSVHISKEELSQLLYLDATIKETLRLYPSIPYIFRTADKTLKFGNFLVPNGTGLFLSIYGVNRNEKYWGSDANEFKPERWMHPSTLPDHPASFAGFGLGRRNCIGQSYAMMSLKTSVFHILRKYRVTADHKKLKFKYEIVLRPIAGNFISIERR